MALPRTPLDDSLLGPAARKALVPGPARMMAAKGLAPIPDPGELISVLYQLAIDADAKIADAAATSVEGLPVRVLEGGLGSGIEARVLDYYAERLRSNAALIQIVILNHATADETLVELAGVLDAKLVDLIATNERRLLACPAIIGAMYNNRRARMSTVDRTVELAVRNEIKVPGISAWDELVKAITTVKRRGDAAAVPADAQTGGEIVEVSEQVDALDLNLDMAAALDMAFMEAAGTGEEPASATEPSESASEAPEIPISQMSIPMKIRLASLGTKFQRATLIRDPIKLVSMAAIKAPGVNEMEASKYAGNNSICDDVITYIANKREWTKLYGVKLSLVQNPKTPIPAAMRFLDHLRQKDLRAVARSKGVSSAIVARAKAKLSNRR